MFTFLSVLEILRACRVCRFARPEDPAFTDRKGHGLSADTIRPPIHRLRHGIHPDSGFESLVFPPWAGVPHISISRFPRGGMSGRC